MAPKKVIKGINIEESDYGRYLKIDESGNLVSADVEHGYVEATGHTTHGLVQTSNGEYTYDISEFTGEGLDPDDIREIYVDTMMYSTNARWTAIYTTMPWDPAGTFHILNYIYQHGNNGNGYGRDSAMTSIPIEKGQTSVIIKLDGNSSLNMSIAGFKTISS